MSAELLSLVAGAVLSLGFAYIPGLKTWFNAKKGTTKRLVLAVSLLIGAGGAFGLACWQPETVVQGLSCSSAGAFELLGLYILALVSNQSTYSIAVKQ